MHQSSFFFLRYSASAKEINPEPPSTPKNPHGLPCPGTHVFIPNSEAIKVGMDIIRVTEVSIFMTIFKLLEITYAYASIVPERISLYIEHISIACLVSTATSSRRSVSSG